MQSGRVGIVNGREKLVGGCKTLFPDHVARFGPSVSAHDDIHHSVSLCP